MKNDRTGAKIDRIILALLEHPTDQKAAAALGVSPVTIWRCKKKPEFQERFYEARREARSRRNARLEYAANTAVAVLQKMMVDKTAPHASVVKAATSILANADAYEKEELAARIERIEQKLGESK